MAKTLPKKLLAFGVAVALGSPAISEEGPGVKAYEFDLPDYIYQQYKDYTADFDPHAIGPVKEEGLWRHLAEAVIFEVAAVKGGCECRITFTEGAANTNFIREVIEIKNGRALSFPIAAFEELIDTEAGDVLLSQPVLRADEFFVGFYTNSNREEILSLTDPDEILGLGYAVGRGWDVDISVLEARDLNIVMADSWYALMRMIKNGRADVVLQPFSREEDFSQVDELSGETLMPIDGYKMAFPHARRFVVSRSHPDGEAFVEALNAGLAEMRESGLLEEYMTKAGVIDPRISEFDEI